MFKGCSRLESGPQLLNLKDVNRASEQTLFHVFDGCNSLKTLEINPTNLDDFGSAFFGSSTSEARLILPEKLEGDAVYCPKTWKAFFLKPLTITAQQDSTTIRLSAVGSPYDVQLFYTEYNPYLKNYVWRVYTPGSQITIAKAGYSVKFRAQRQNDRFSRDDSRYYRFVVNKTVDVSGDLQTLLDFTACVTEVPDYAFYNLFNITSIASAPELSATTVGSYAYAHLFENCYNMTSGPTQLPATTIGDHAYEAMFCNCNNMKNGPKTIAATSLGAEACRQMFYSCVRMESAPAVLPATTVPNGAYRQMFYDCRSMTNVPDIQAAQFTGTCNMKQMFKQCPNITSGPTLRPMQLTDSCYAEMFYACQKLNSLEVRFINWNTSNGSTFNWVRGVASTGTFNSSLTLPQTNGYDNIPYGWNVVKKNGQLCFTAQQAGSSVTLTRVGLPQSTISLLYSTDGSLWRYYTVGTKIDLANVGDKVLFSAEGVNAKFSTGIATNSNYYGFVMTGKVAGSGNVMSLLDENMEQTFVPDYALYNLFRDCSALTQAPTMSALKVGLRGCSCMYAYCTGLTSAPELPATSVGEYGYDCMFYGCTGITKAPELGATTLGNYCYQSMFKECSKLTTAPTILPATQLATSCYNGMFHSCSKLTTVPQLPANDMAYRCYFEMFRACTSLKIGPALPAENLDIDCYRGMFNGCKSLQRLASGLKAQTLKNGCYNNMFRNCGAMTSAPGIAATTLASGAMEEMFYGCSKLSQAGVSFTDWDTAESATTNWLQGVAETGNLNCPKALDCSSTGSSTIPVGWTKTLHSPLCFTMARSPKGDYARTGVELVCSAQESNAVELLYSYDGNTWQDYTKNEEIYLSKVGDKVYFKAKSINPGFSQSESYYYFLASDNIDVSGNVMSLLDNTCTQNWVPDYAFNCLFTGSGTQTAPELPAPELGTACYMSMFHDCDSLLAAPQLPATKMANSCYERMFEDCESMTAAPQLPATALAPHCYEYMFAGAAISSAPVLSATTMQDSCYYGMFSGCKQLTSAPALPATVLAPGCYSYMFNYCTSLAQASALPAKQLAASCYEHMFSDCSRLKELSALPATTLADHCYSFMFSNCSDLQSAPAKLLPATTLAEQCYYGMFWNCTSLTKAPELPATKMSKGCYSDMFYGCTSLTTAPALPATKVVDYCYSSMFYGCSSLTTAPVLPASTLAEYCYSNMFDNCTALEYAPLLPALAAETRSYFMMFDGCSKLKQVELNLLSGFDYTMLEHTNTTGTLIVSEELDALLSKNNYQSVPSGWTVKFVRRGNVDGNGGISVSDLTTLIDRLHKGTAASLDAKAADMDLNGVINTNDVSPLAKKVLNL